MNYKSYSIKKQSGHTLIAVLIFTVVSAACAGWFLYYEADSANQSLKKKNDSLAVRLEGKNSEYHLSLDKLQDQINQQ